MAWKSHLVAADLTGSFMQSRYGYNGLVDYEVSYAGTAGSVLILVRD